MNLNLLPPLLVIAATVCLVYWIGYPWPWSGALTALPRFLPEAEPEPLARWTPTPEREPEPCRYWFLRFSVPPATKVYEQWAYGDTVVAALRAISESIGGKFIVYVGAPYHRLNPPRLDVRVFGEPPAQSICRAAHQTAYPVVNARLALSEVQRSELPPMRFSPNSGLIDGVVNSVDTAPLLERVRYIVPQSWLAIPAVAASLRDLHKTGKVDVLVMRHINGPARPFSDFT